MEQYNVLKMFTFIWASTILVWPRKLTFKVTPKHADDSVQSLERRQLTPHLLMLVGIGLSVLVAAVNLVIGLTASYCGRGIIVVTIFWASANGGIMALGVRNVLGRFHHRQSFRFPVRVAASVVRPDGGVVRGVTENLSKEGVGL